MSASFEQDQSVSRQSARNAVGDGAQPTAGRLLGGSQPDPSGRPPLLRFLDAFLQEQNIKWILGVGLAIVFGSSAMLVAADWRSFPPLWKFATLLGYTALIHGAGQLAWRRLGLRKTGTFLMALTVLLIPVDFLALRWLAHAAQGGSAGSLAWWFAGGTGFVFATAAARRIFGLFLRGTPLVFLAAYLMLCVAGALPPGLAAPWNLLQASVLWLVLTAGVVQVNRHVFWLVEERRWPRVCGFFPIGLLGAQFLLLFGLNVAPTLATDWLGLACALLAVPILLTADAALGVFEKRTGGLVRPVPLNIVLPFVGGLLLCAAGLVLAATGWPSPYALVPTALVVAVLMGVAARRTQEPGLVWFLLIAIAAAYRFCPLYFQEFARLVVEQGAAAVHEQSLPLAFYGLTFLPLIAALMTIGDRLDRRGNHLFSRPIQQFVTVLSGLLFALSLTHPKAVLPVGLVMTAVFAIQARLSRRWLSAGAAALSLIAAGWGLEDFVRTVLLWAAPADLRLLSLAGVAVLLIGPGTWVDRWVRMSRNRWIAPTVEEHPCRCASLALSLTLAAWWLLQYGIVSAAPAAWFPAGMIAALLVAHALVWLRPGLGEAAIVFAGLAPLLSAARQGAPPSWLVTLASFGLLALWAVSILLKRTPGARVSRAFADAAGNVGLAGLFAAAVYHLGMFGLAMAGFRPEFSWWCGLLVVAWTFDAARRLANPCPAVLGALGLYGLAGSALILNSGSAGTEWLPAVWAGVAFACVPLGAAIERRNRTRRMAAVTRPLDVTARVVLFLMAVASPVVFSWPMRLAGGIAVCGVFLISRVREKSGFGSLAFAAANWQALAAVCGSCVPEISGVAELKLAATELFAFPLACATAGSLLLSGFVLPRCEAAGREVLMLHRMALRVAVAVLLVVMLDVWPLTLDAWQAVLLASAFAMLAADELLAAIRRREAVRVWLAEAIAAAGTGYLALFGVIAVGHGTTMFAVLGTAVMLGTTARLAQRRQETAVISGPLSTTARLLPLATVAIGLIRHLTHADPRWLGINSLALLLAAGFYFHVGIERNRRSPIVLAAAILNVALALLWNELRWSDPQLFMIPLGISILALVEFLKQDLPSTVRTPLRYTGALVILVSPTFHIVGGSWLHLATLMAASVAVTFAGIGLRLKPLAYLGTGFLAADLVAMVVRGSIDHPNLLWVAGIAMGGAVIALAAWCENHREALLAQLRRLTAELEAWE